MQASFERIHEQSRESFEVEVASLDDLPLGSTLAFHREGRSYVLHHGEAGLACLDGVCPHQRGALTEFGEGGEFVTCSKNGCLRFRFDTRTGRCLQHPRVAVRAYPARIHGGRIVVDLRR
ncbi:Rieske (2Fe-2S) protein [Singulisphaera sp. PoT]|uniref:Rieske (2Fe-2S) protein n=1 Tax=Singulisphaera sp. PoT TaxID=3411797 RepID=UPI003BF5414F